MLSIGSCNQSTVSTELSAIVSNTIASMRDVKSCTVNTDIAETYHLVPDTDIVVRDAVWERLSYRQTDIVNRRSFLKVDIHDTSGAPVSSYAYDVIDTDGRQYYQQTEPQVFGSSGNTGAWTRKQTAELDRDGWLAKAQITPQLSLLKDLSIFKLNAAETISDKEYFTLEAALPAAAATDWLLSLDQYSGPSLGWFRVNAERNREIYLKAFQSGTALLWIDKESHRIFKVAIELKFDAVPGNITKQDTGLPIFEGDDMNDVGFKHIVRTFSGILDFSG
jgi:hypothetical protein